MRCYDPEEGDFHEKKSQQSKTVQYLNNKNNLTLNIKSYGKRYSRIPDQKQEKFFNLKGHRHPLFLSQELYLQ